MDQFIGEAPYIPSPRIHHDSPLALPRTDSCRQAIVQSQREGSGTFIIRASAPGLKSSEMPILITAAAAPPAVPPPLSVVDLTKWMQSPVSKHPVDPDVSVAENDMNSWSSVQAVTAQDFTGGPWALLRCKFTPRDEISARSGLLHFKEISSAAEIYVDGVRVEQKNTLDSTALKVALPPKAGPCLVSVRIHAGTSKITGPTGPVTIEPDSAHKR